MQPLYTHLAKYASSVQVGGKSSAKDIEVIEKNGKRLKRREKYETRRSKETVYVYVGSCTNSKRWKMDKESLAKLNQVIIDGLLV